MNLFLVLLPQLLKCGDSTTLAFCFVLLKHLKSQGTGPPLTTVECFSFPSEETGRERRTPYILERKGVCVCVGLQVVKSTSCL